MLTTKCLVSDLDGTLLNPEGIVTDNLKMALLKYQASGGTLIFATGRSYKEARSPLAWLKGERVYFICGNGMRTYDADGVLLDKRTGIHTESVVSVLDIAIKARCGVNVFSEHSNIALLAVGSLSLCAKNAVRRVQGHTGRKIMTFDRLIAFSKLNAAEKIWLKARSDDNAERLIDTVQSAVGSSCDVYRLDDYSVLEVCSHDSNKLPAILALLSCLNIPESSVTVVGDDGNDVAMLRHFESSFSMENGTVEAKRASAFIAPSNSDEGFLAVMKGITADEI